MLASVGLTSGQGHLGILMEAVVGRGCRRIGKHQPCVVENAKCGGFGRRFVGATWRSKQYRYGGLSKKERSSQTLEEGRSRVVQCSSSKLQSLQVEISGAEQLQQLLENIHKAMGLQDYHPRQHITLSGVQVLMGMEGQWTLTWNIDGRFYERYEGHELHFEWAYDGELEPWSADAAGRVASLDLDDREVCLLATWIRTGYWLTDGAQKKLNLHLDQQKSNARETTFKVQMKEFKPGYRSQYARAIVHNPPAGGNDLYTLTDVKVDHCDGELEDKETRMGSLYNKPTSKLVPRRTWSYPKTHINNEMPSSVMMVQADSGHYLVRPLVDGQDIGYFIVDTGASSLTIAPDKAKELGMYEFGEAYVTGVEGEVKCQFRRAKSFQIGPLTITEPIFMEVPMAGVVRGVSPVAGICGYDIFFHCIVEMSYKKATLSLYDPLVYNYSFIRPSQWQGMYLLENVPHVPATFNGNEAIFLLDTGAGGVDLIFHGRAVERYRLNQTLLLAGTASVKGINTSGKGLQVQYGILDTFQVAGQTFQKVKVLFPAVGSCGSLDFSEYTAGVLCGDLLENLLLVLDYGCRRFAFINSEGAGRASSRMNSMVLCIYDVPAMVVIQ